MFGFQISTLSFAPHASVTKSVIEPSLSPISSSSMEEGSSSPSLLSETRHFGMFAGPKKHLKSLSSYRFCRPMLETHSPNVRDPVANGLAYIYIYMYIHTSKGGVVFILLLQKNHAMSIDSDFLVGNIHEIMRPSRRHCAATGFWMCSVEDGERKPPLFEWEDTTKKVLHEMDYWRSTP